MPNLQLAIGEKQPFWDANGNPLTGGKLFVYSAGTTTKATSYQETTGTTANTNPIILNGRGEVPAGLYVASGLYKLVLAPSTDTDPPSSPIWTRDNLTAVNDVLLISSQWVSFGGTPTWLSTTTFSVIGDQTSTFLVGRRIQVFDSGGTKYAYITAASFGAGVTTVTVVLDSGVLANPITSVSLGLLTPTNPSTPLLADTFPIVSGSADSTKRTRFEVDGIPTGITRVQFPGMPINTQTTSYTVIESDFGKVINGTGTWTLSLTAAATLGVGFWCWVSNTGTGTITIDPNASETIRIPGGPQTPGTSITLPYSGTAEGPYNVSGVLLWCDGTNWNVVATNETHGTVSFTGNGTWTAPAGVTTIFVTGCGAGGGGGSLTGGAGNAGGGGGGGAGVINNRLTVVPGTAYTVTIGNGGTGSAGANGTNGGATSLGAILTLNPGLAGVANSAGGAGGVAPTGGVSGSNGGNGTGAGGCATGTGGGLSIFGGAPQALGNGVSAGGWGGGGGGGGNAINAPGGAGSNGFISIAW